MDKDSKGQRKLEDYFLQWKGTAYNRIVRAEAPPSLQELETSVCSDHFWQ